ncbi:hypothetical protein MGA3_04745 [Bacillus methanolicus MGA3]|nr:hypothetical protein MGA3_04745 [Bacillus methanolicus MGA3]
MNKEISKNILKSRIFSINFFKNIFKKFDFYGLFAAKKGKYPL